MQCSRPDVDPAAAVAAALKGTDKLYVIVIAFTHVSEASVHSSRSAGQATSETVETAILLHDLHAKDTSIW